MEYKKNRLEDSTDSHGLEQEGEGKISDSFNNDMIGLPMTGTRKSAIKANQKKYGIFDSKEIGGHFGRSGSPKGAGREEY